MNSTAAPPFSTDAVLPVLAPPDPNVLAALAALDADTRVVTGVNDSLEVVVATLGSALAAAPGWQGPARDLFDGKRGDLAGRVAAAIGQLGQAQAEILGAVGRLHAAL